MRVYLKTLVAILAATSDDHARAHATEVLTDGLSEHFPNEFNPDLFMSSVEKERAKKVPVGDAAVAAADLTKTLVDGYHGDTNPQVALVTALEKARDLVMKLEAATAPPVAVEPASDTLVSVP